MCVEGEGIGKWYAFFFNDYPVFLSNRRTGLITTQLV